MNQILQNWSKENVFLKLLFKSGNTTEDVQKQGRKFVAQARNVAMSVW